MFLFEAELCYNMYIVIYEVLELKTFSIITFGCQMNENDSEKLSGILQNMGYTKTEDHENCDVLIMNTCSVRENADDRFFGNLGSFKAVKAKRPDMVLAVCGCMMQQKEIVDIIKKKYKFVDIVFGTHNIHLFGELLNRYLVGGKPVYDIWNDADELTENVPVSREYKHKALVNIMNGCDNFCTYCIVPYTRGREKSREEKHIIDEIKSLVLDGCKEVMLLGQNVNSYGKGLKNPCTFAGLLEDVSRIDGLERIRFMTSHPKDLTDDVIKVIKNHENICHSIHLPVQSGSSRILKLMNRKYTKEEYVSLIEKIRNEIPDITITTDIIVGFPGETEEDFLETLDVVEKCRFDSAFTFIYSPRRGTKAAVMPEQISKEVIQQRFDRLLKLQYEIMYENAKIYENQVVEVIVEGESKTDKAMMSGRTKTNKLVNFSGKCNVGDTVNVKITQAATFHLTGEII